MNLSENMSDRTTTPQNGQNQGKIQGAAPLVILTDGTPLADSRVIAAHCEVQHANLYELLKDYKTTIEDSFGQVRFETGDGIQLPQGGRTAPVKFALLTEDQSTVLITFLRNSGPVVKFKIALVKAFAEAKRLLSGGDAVGFRLPRTFSEALRALADTTETNEKLTRTNDRLTDGNAILLRENDAMAPKALLYDVAMASTDLLKMNEVAKLLCGDGTETGQNRLYRFLRKERILRTCLYDDGSAKKEHNTPYQVHIDSGYFHVKEFPFNTRNHGPKVSLTTFVTQKGLEFIRRRLSRA